MIGTNVGVDETTEHGERVFKIKIFERLGQKIRLED